MTGQAFLALYAVMFVLILPAMFLSSLNAVHTSAYLLQMMVSFFLNGTEMFQGIECQQAVVTGTERIRNFAVALT